MLEFTKLTTLADALRAHARERPNAIVLDYKDRITTYQELDERTSRVANQLLALGQKPGARIAYLGKKCDRFWEVVFGAIKARAAVMSANWRLAPAELQFIISDSECEILMVSREFYPVVEKLRTDLPRLKSVIAMDGGHPEWPEYETWRDSASAEDPNLESSRDDALMQIYTSGTTGMPKGVPITHASVLWMYANPLPEIDPFKEGDVVLIAMPFFHVSGCGMGLTTISHGAKGVVLPEVEPRELLRLIETKGITHTTLVPAVVLALTQFPETAKIDTSTLKRITYGGSPIPEAVAARAMELLGCDFMQAYGLTETSGGPVTYLPPSDHRPGRGKLRSCGKAAPGREIRIVDEKGQAQPVGAVGEIIVRSPCVMPGYWKREEANAEAIDQDGWFHTGDAGYFDEEGYLYIYDRVKEMIVSGGENIYPAEVENALAGHPAVQDVAVIGVPDEKWGEAVKAIVAAKAEVSEAELIAYARERIAGYKLPKSIDFIAKVPRNPSGKIMRRDLRKPYWEGRDRQVN